MKPNKSFKRVYLNPNTEYTTFYRDENRSTEHTSEIKLDNKFFSPSHLNNLMFSTSNQRSHNNSQLSFYNSQKPTFNKIYGRNSIVISRKSTNLNQIYARSSLVSSRKSSNLNLSELKFSILEPNNHTSQNINDVPLEDINGTKYYQRKSLNQFLRAQKEKAKKKRLLEYHYNEKNDVERIYQGFSCDSKNPSFCPNYLYKKYGDKFKSIYVLEKEHNNQEDVIKKKLKESIISVKLKKDKDEEKYLEIKKTRKSQISRLKLKWKTIKWFLEKKKDIIDKLIQNDKLMKKFKEMTNLLKRGLNKDEFFKLITNHHITFDSEVISKLFWVFDEDGSGDIEYKELAFGLEMFTESSMETKLKVFFDLCDVDGSGAITKSEFLNMMKKNIIHPNERLMMKQVVERIFKSVELDKNGEITFENLKIGSQKNKLIYNIIEKNLKALKNIDEIIETNVKKEFMEFNPILNQKIRRKLIGTQDMLIPIKELRFEKMINSLEKIKEERNALKILNIQLNENNMTENESIYGFF